MDESRDTAVTPMAARNPAEAQVDILLEAQRSIGKRLTSLEIAVAQLTDAVSLQDQVAQKSLRILHAEIEALRQLVTRDPAPRRCSHCFCVVNASATACPSCAKSL
jgi:tRNA(Arg) A34 adenosine deaminase TadA